MWRTSGGIQTYTVYRPPFIFGSLTHGAIGGTNDCQGVGTRVFGFKSFVFLVGFLYMGLYKAYSQGDTFEVKIGVLVHIFRPSISSP